MHIHTYVSLCSQSLTQPGRQAGAFCGDLGTAIKSTPTWKRCGISLAFKFFNWFGARHANAENYVHTYSIYYMHICRFIYSTSVGVCVCVLEWELPWSTQRVVERPQKHYTLFRRSSSCPRMVVRVCVPGCVCVCMRSAINPETMDEDILMYSAQLKHKANYAQLIRSLSLFPSPSVSFSCSLSLSVFTLNHNLR